MLRGSACSAPTSATGCARSGLEPPALDSLHLDSSMLARQSATVEFPPSAPGRFRADLVTFAVDMCQAGASPSLRRPACFGPLLSASGPARSDGFSSAPDFADMDSALPTRSFLCPEPCASAPDSSLPGPSLMSRSISRPGFLSAGDIRLDPFLPALDSAQGYTTSPRSFACPDAASSALGMSSLDSPSSLHTRTHLESFLPLARAAQLGPALSALDPGTGRAPSPRTLARSDLAPFLVDCAHTGATLSLQSLSQVGAAVPVCGNCQLGSPLLLQSFAKLEPPMSVADFSACGTPMLVQSLVTPGFGSSVLDAVVMGSPLLLRSLLYVGLGLSMVDIVLLGLPMALRAFSRAEVILFASGCQRMELSLSACDLCPVGLLLLIQNFAWLGFRTSAQTHTRPDPLPSTMDHSHIPSLSLRGCSQVGSVTPACGFGRPGFLPSAPDSLHLGAAVPLQSAARVGLSTSVLSTASLEATSSTRRLFCLELMLSPAGQFVQADGVWNVGESLPVTSAARPGSGIPASCRAHFDSLSSALDSITLGPPLLLHSLCRCASSLLAVGFSRLDVLTSLSDCTAVGPSVSLRQLACTGFAFLALGARLGSPPSVLDFSTSGSALLLQQLAQPEPASFAFSRYIPGLPSPLFGCEHLDSASLAHSSSQPGFLLSAMQCVSLGLMVPPRSRAHLEVSLPTASMCRLGPPLLPSDCVQAGTALLMRCSAQLDSPAAASSRSCAGALLLVLDLMSPETSPPPHASARMDLYLLMAGIACAGPSLLVCGSGNAASSIPLRSVSKTDASPSSAELALPDVSVPPRNSARLGSALLAVASARCDASSPLSDVAHLELFSSARSFA